MELRELLLQRQVEKDETVVEIGRVLGVLEAEGREPDHWERRFLVHAFAGFFAGLYGLAIADARLALTAQHDRGDVRLADPMADQADLTFLRKAFDAAQAEPVRLYPHLGPHLLQ